MKTILLITLTVLVCVFLAMSIYPQGALSLESSPMNSDLTGSSMDSTLTGSSLNSSKKEETLPDITQEELLSETTSDESLADDEEEAKGPCPPPYIKLVSPRAAAAGDTISIQGWRFGKDFGQVIFHEGIGAKIISWRYQRIEVMVPDKAETGNITVISACGTENKKGAGGYFKVLKKEKEE